MSSNVGNTDTTHEALLAWRRMISGTSHTILQAVKDIAIEASAGVADEFYSNMQGHPRAGTFLSHDVVNRRLHKAMQRWLVRTFSTLAPEALPATVAHQVEVGEIHARIKLPPDLMSTGVRALKAAVMRRVLDTMHDPEERLAACLYVSDVIHLADGLMNSAYIRTIQHTVRNDEAYRTVALKHDAALERERQRAALSEWAQKFLFAIGRRSRKVAAVPLGKSEFALWMKHKAQVLFENMPDVQHVYEAMSHIDQVLVPQLMATDIPEENEERLVEDLERQVEFIRYLVGDLFDRLNQVEQGRDTVTRLFNRRYLLSILSRELEEHRRNSQPFGVLLARVDNVAAFGEDAEARNLLLQQVALTLQGAVRCGDHSFRYGEDEFLVIAVENTAADVDWTANQIRNNIRAQSIMLRGTSTQAVSVSIGVANYDGHPDYQYLLGRAQDALRQACARGGNCIETS
jgi:diguanylate cyclase